MKWNGSFLCFDECYNQFPHVQTSLSVYKGITAIKEYKVQTNRHLTADCGIVDKNIWVIIQRGHKSVQSTMRKSIIPFALKERNGELEKNCTWGNIQPNHLGVDSASGVIPVLQRIIWKIIYSSVGCAFCAVYILCSWEWWKHILMSSEGTQQLWTDLTALVTDIEICTVRVELFGMDDRFKTKRVFNLIIYICKAEKSTPVTTAFRRALKQR